MPLPSFIDLHKKPEEEEENPWLISFSDMMSLLLCFFIVLVALSGLDLVRLEMFGERFARPERITMKRLQQMIQEFIDSERLQKDVSVRLTSKGVEISFKDKLLFDLGEATLKPEAMSILTKISGLLNYKEISQRKIYVEGHTDSLPIKSAIYPSNWELSSARAANVVKFFIARGLESKRFESIGYADTQPVKPETDKILGQPENRRVVVVISPESYLAKTVRKEISIEPYPEKISQKEIQYTELAKELKQITIGAVPQPQSLPSTKAGIRETTASRFHRDDKRSRDDTLERRDKPTMVPGKKASKKSQMEIYFSLGQKYFKEKNYKKAIEAWKKVLELDPKHQLSKTNIQRAKKRLAGK